MIISGPGHWGGGWRNHTFSTDGFGVNRRIPYGSMLAFREIGGDDTTDRGRGNRFIDEDVGLSLYRIPIRLHLLKWFGKEWWSFAEEWMSCRRHRPGIICLLNIVSVFINGYRNI